MSDILDLQKRARQIRQKYDQQNEAEGGKKWTGIDYVEGFIGDAGTLMKLTMAKEGKRRGSDVDIKMQHELGDCLWSLFMIADEYEIDLQEAFTGTMDELDERLSA